MLQCSQRVTHVLEDTTLINVTCFNSKLPHNFASLTSIYSNKFFFIIDKLVVDITQFNVINYIFLSMFLVFAIFNLFMDLRFTKMINIVNNILQ